MRTKPSPTERDAVPEAVQQVIVQMAEEYDLSVTATAVACGIIAVCHERGLIEYRESDGL